MAENEIKKGGISVETEHIFPIIKKWLYSEKEIFLRELVSNAADAITKLKRLASLGQYEADGNAYRIDVSFNKSEKTLTVSDNGIGMTEEEVVENIGTIAQSGTKAFLKQLEENKNTISSLRKQLEDKNFIIADLNDDLNLLNEKLNSQNGDSNTDSEFISKEQFTSSSNSYSFDDYVELQKEYIALLKKYERSQEDLYNEKVKVIHYKNLLDKFKNFILRIQ